MNIILLNILGEAIIQGFYVTESGVSSEDVGSEKTHFQLAKALSVMKIKASTFYSHFNSGDHEKVKELLDDALKDRMKQWTAEGLGIEEQHLSKKEQKELKSSNTKLNKAEDIQGPQSQTRLFVLGFMGCKKGIFYIVRSFSET